MSRLGDGQLGEALKAARKASKMTLSEVGAGLGLANGNFVGMVERGERTPSDEKLLDFARLLSLDARELLAMKYQGSHPAAFDVLLRPPRPLYPRLRRLLLSSCENPEVMAPEFENSEQGLLEHLVFRTLLDHILLPALARDRYAPRRLRERMAAHRELREEGQPLPTSLFEEQAETFIPWVRGELPMLSWRLDPIGLEFSFSRGQKDDEAWSISLCGADLLVTPIHGGRSEKTRSRPGNGQGLGLRDLVADEGLDPDEVSEVLDLIEWKKTRRRQALQDDR
jgi:transcriptional regulator with XRE-family HTH domain